MFLHKNVQLLADGRLLINISELYLPLLDICDMNTRNAICNLEMNVVCKCQNI